MSLIALAYLSCSIALQPIQESSQAAEQAPIRDSPPRTAGISEPRPYFKPEVPDALSRTELLNLAIILDLSEAQLSALDSLIERYKEQMLRFKATDVDPLIERSMDIHELDVLSDQTAAQLMAEWLLDCEKSATKAESHVDSLLVDLSAVLAEGQLQSLSRVRNVRVRQSATLQADAFPAADMDVYLLTLDASRDYGLGGIPSTEEVKEIFDSYDSQSAALARARIRGATKRSCGFYVAMADAYQEWLRAPSERDRIRTHREEQKRKATKPLIDSLKGMRRLNEQTIDLLEERIPKEVHTAISNRFRNSAFPYTFPNPYDIGGLLSSATKSIAPLTEEPAIDIVREWYHATEEVLREMESLDIKWQLRLIESRGVNGNELASFQRAMRSLDNQRRELTKRALSQLEVLVPDSMAESFKNLSDAHHERSRAILHDRVARSDDGEPWPAAILSR